MTIGTQEAEAPARANVLRGLAAWNTQEGWRAFFQTYWRVIYRAARRAGLTEAESEEVVRGTVLHMVGHRAELRRDPALGPFKGWLLAATRRSIQEQIRKRDRAGGPAPDVEAVWEDAWRTSLFQAALDRVRRKVDPRCFQMYECVAVKGWPLRRVARLSHACVGRVMLAWGRTGCLVWWESRQLEKGCLG